MSKKPREYLLMCILLAFISAISLIVSIAYVQSPNQIVRLCGILSFIIFGLGSGYRIRQEEEWNRRRKKRNAI